MKLLKVRLICMAATVMTISACGSDSGTSSDPAAVSQNFVSLSQSVIPVIGDGSQTGQLASTSLIAAASGSCDETTNWLCHAWANNAGHMAIRLFALFGNNALDPANTYINTTPGGKELGWGVENVANNLNIFDGLSSGLTNTAPATYSGSNEGIDYTVTTSALNTYSPLQTIVGFAEFSDLNPVTYQYHRTGDITVTGLGGSFGTLHLGWKNDSPLSNIISGMNATDGSEKSVGVGQYNSNTQELIVYNATHTTEGGSPSFHMLMEIKGNAGDHSFTMKRFSKTPGVGKFKSAIVATGVSQGAGEYYLIKETHWESADDDTPPAPTYICISAEATIDHFELAYNSGGVFVGVSDNTGKEFIKVATTSQAPGWCGGKTYETTLDGIPFYTNSQLPTDAASFNSAFSN